MSWVGHNPHPRGDRGLRPHAAAAHQRPRQRHREGDGSKAGRKIHPEEVYYLHLKDGLPLLALPLAAAVGASSRESE